MFCKALNHYVSHPDITVPFIAGSGIPGSAKIALTLCLFWISCCQAEALDGGKRWKNEKVAEEKAPPAGFGSPSKGQAINLLDTVSGGISSRTKHLAVNSLHAINILLWLSLSLSLPGGARIPQAECKRAEGLRGHPASHQVLLPHCPQKHPRQV